MLILGVESSCDETAFAVVRDGARVLSNAVASQVELHARFGGVVPEIASRAHLECCVALHRQALSDAAVTMADIDAIAVTRGPGLAGCLLVGVEYAKALALRHGKPLVCVHHIAGHIWSPWLGRKTDAWGNAADGTAAFAPYLALIVSGGHSSLIHVRTPLEYEILGETLDDAAGEAYDKVAKLLGLGYPGGPLVDRLAATGNPSAFDLPRPMMRSDAGFDFSFSGLKTAVARQVELAPSPRDARFIADMCASFQAAVIDVLLDKARRAIKKTGLRRLAIAGGVACNRGLRAAAPERLRGITIAFPAPEYCGDNAAMIAGLGFHVHRAGLNADDAFNAEPGSPLSAGLTGWA